MTKLLLILAALAAILSAGVETAHIGRVFEEKSLNSYALKTSDLDPTSASALAHIHGAAAYGRSVALRVALSGCILGIVLGIAMFKWIAGRSSHAT